MKIVPRLILLIAVVALAGCAESLQPADNHSASISVPAATNPDNPPPTLSGYVDTSFTSQVR